MTVSLKFCWSSHWSAFLASHYISNSNIGGKQSKLDKWDISLKLFLNTTAYFSNSCIVFNEILGFLFRFAKFLSLKTNHDLNEFNHLMIEIDLIMGLKFQVMSSPKKPLSSTLIDLYRTMKTNCKIVLYIRVDSKMKKNK